MIKRNYIHELIELAQSVALVIVTESILLGVLFL